MIPLLLTLLLLDASTGHRPDHIYSDTSSGESSFDPDWGRGMLSFLQGLSGGKKVVPQTQQQELKKPSNDEESEKRSLSVLPLLPTPEYQSSKPGSLFKLQLQPPTQSVSYDPKPSFLNEKLSLYLWESVEKMFRDLLLSAHQSQKLTLKDRSTHLAAVMYTVVDLAYNLKETCSTSQYVRNYRKTVSESLMQVFTSPLEAVKNLLDLMERTRKGTANIRALLRTTPLAKCGPSDNSLRCAQKYDLPSRILQLNRQLNKEKLLIQALGSLARTVIASKSLKKAIDNYDEVAYLLSGGNGANLYVLCVKTARVLKLLGNKETCDVPLVPTLNAADDSSDSDESSSSSETETFTQRIYV